MNKYKYFFALLFSIFFLSCSNIWNDSSEESISEHYNKNYTSNYTSINVNSDSATSSSSFEKTYISAYSQKNYTFYSDSGYKYYIQLLDNKYSSNYCSVSVSISGVSTTIDTSTNSSFTTYSFTPNYYGNCTITITNNNGYSGYAGIYVYKKSNTIKYKYCSDYDDIDANSVNTYTPYYYGNSSVTVADLLSYTGFSYTAVYYKNGNSLHKCSSSDILNESTTYIIASSNIQNLLDLEVEGKLQSLDIPVGSSSDISGYQVLNISDKQYYKIDAKNGYSYYIEFIDKDNPTLLTDSGYSSDDVVDGKYTLYNSSGNIWVTKDDGTDLYSFYQNDSDSTYILCIEPFSSEDSGSCAFRVYKNK